MASATGSLRPGQLHTCNLSLTSTKRHSCRASHTSCDRDYPSASAKRPGELGPRALSDLSLCLQQAAAQGQLAWPARTRVDATDPCTSSTVIATSRWSRQALSTSR